MAQRAMAQRAMAVELYRLLETHVDLQGILQIISQIDDLNRWNFDTINYFQQSMGDSSGMNEYVIDVEQIEEGQDKGETILDFIIWLITETEDYEFKYYPYIDKIVSNLISAGAISNSDVFQFWLDLENYFIGNNRGKYLLIRNLLKPGHAKLLKSKQRLALATMDKGPLLTKLPDDLLEQIGKVHKKGLLPVETLKRMDDTGQYGGSKRRKSKKRKSKRRKSNKKKSNKRKSNKRKSNKRKSNKRKSNKKKSKFS